MKTFNILLLVFIILFLLINYDTRILDNFTILDDNSSITEKDKNYLKKFKKKTMSYLISNNKIKIPLNKKNKILILTFDNRANIPYIIMHNKNFIDYVNKWKIDYKFYDKCKYNVYWCKIHMVLDELISKKYDYVMWVDSDTYIFNMGINLSDVLNSFSSDIFVGSDNHQKYDIINAGVFIIKNTPIGKQYLQECIDSLDPDCIIINNKQQSKLNGNWAGTCYEQGVMNILIADKYSYYTTVLDNNIIHNDGSCDNNTFIMHLYGSSNDTRVKCFSNK